MKSKPLPIRIRDRRIGRYQRSVRWAVLDWLIIIRLASRGLGKQTDRAVIDWPRQRNVVGLLLFWEGKQWIFTGFLSCRSQARLGR